MYYTKRDYKKGYYIIACSLDKYLKKIGISQEEIEKSKSWILEGKKNNYKRKSSEGKPEYIDPKKIIGGSRLTPGVSVYSNVEEFKIDTLVRERLENQFALIEDRRKEGYDIKTIREDYENIEEPIIVDYYEDIDKYYISLNGNHRGIMAMILGVEKIKADVYYMKRV